MRLITLIFLFTAIVAQAATNGQLLVKGTVPSVISIAVTPLAIATTLPLDTTQAQTVVANINESWNTRSGVQISISSANQGQLVHQNNTNSRISYVLRYRNTNLNLSSGTTINVNTSGVQNVTNPVAISYTGQTQQFLIQGDYTDVVTFTISAL